MCPALWSFGANDTDHSSTTAYFDSAFFGAPSAWSQVFAYDAFGNLTKTVPSGGTGNSFQPTYSTSTNHITNLAGFTPTYDPDGDVTNDSNHTYSWDARGNPTTVDGISNSFDALDLMVDQNRSGTHTQIVYAPTGQKFALMNGSQTLLKAFFPLPGRAEAVYNSGGLLYYGHSDHLGSIRVASTPSRAYSFGVAYAPFGETYASSGTPDIAFTGQRQDTSTGLYDFPAREYSTEGRWASPDPAGFAAVDPTNPQSWNRYAYVGNSPLSQTDPFGLWDIPGYRSSGGAGGGGFGWLNNIYWSLGFGSIEGNGINGMGSACSLDGVGTSCSGLIQAIQAGVTYSSATGSGGTFQIWTPGGSVSSDAGVANYDGFWSTINLGGDSSWWGTFGSTFVNGVLHGVRRPGQSFSACVNQNISNTTGGTVNPQKLATTIPATAVGVAGALAGKVPFNIPFDPGTGGIAAFTASAYGLGRALGASGAGMGALIGAANGVGYGLAIAGSATAGLVIGSAINCR